MSYEILDKWYKKFKKDNIVYIHENKEKLNKFEELLSWYSQFDKEKAKQIPGICLRTFSGRFKEEYTTIVVIKTEITRTSRKGTSTTAMEEQNEFIGLSLEWPMEAAKKWAKAQRLNMEKTEFLVHEFKVHRLTDDEMEYAMEAYEDRTKGLRKSLMYEDSIGGD